jgi:D-glycero-alpha-D-manno-heptose-7-phosphate kinase
MQTSRMTKVRIPVRIDFAGGWSDVDYFAAREGGAVLNAAINLFVEGKGSWEGSNLRVSYHSDVPTGCGLGSSAAINVAWLAITNGVMGRLQSAIQLAEAAFHLENRILGIEGGKQDAYASALGGFNLLQIRAKDMPATVEPLRLPSGIIQALEERSVLTYSGIRRDSGAVHGGVWERYLQGDSGVAANLRVIRDSALPARDALASADFEALARILTKNRECVRHFNAGVITPRMDELFSAGEDSGAVGSKPCGAGGGGCLFFLCMKETKTEVEATLLEHGAAIIPFKFQPVSYWASI